MPQKQAQEVLVGEQESEEDEEESEGEDLEEDDIDDGTLQTNIVMSAEVEMSEAVDHMHIESPTQRETFRVGFEDTMQTPEGESEQAETPMFVVDTVGDPSLAMRPRTNGKQPAARSPSPTPSNSSEEVVVFRGRSNPAPAADPPTRTKYKEKLTLADDGGYEARTISTAAVKPNEGFGQKTIPTKTENKQPIAIRAPKPVPSHQAYHIATPLSSSPLQQQPPKSAIGWASHSSKFEDEVAPDTTWAPAPSGSWWKNKSKKLRPDLAPPESEKLAIGKKPRGPSKVMFAEPQATPEEVAAMPETSSGEKDVEETISSLQAEVRSMQRSKRRARQVSREQDEISILASAATATPQRRGKRGRKRDNRQLRNLIDDEGEDEDAEEAAFVDYMHNLADQQLDGANDAIFGRTAHASTFGPSLVIDGEEVGDDEVLPSHFDMMNNSDTSSEDTGPIGQDTSEISGDENADWSDMESSELEEELEYTEREQWEDEQDLRQRRQDAMTDEQIARLFAKQQELGIDDDELVIDNGEYVAMSDDMDGIGDIARARAGLANISNSSFARPNKHGVRRRNNRDFSFPDASALADTVEQYGENGFDIMDFERPSLRPTRKGRKGTLPPELEALSDEELKETMRTTWANDRSKKSAKKAEREALRMEGLLGTPGRQGKADLSAKYPFGISLPQIHEELKEFLANENQQSRPFPPMKKHDRKALHEIAAVLKLSSKSVGSGHDRFPVLSKTSRTNYAPAVLDRAIAASDKGFLGHGSRTARKLTRSNEKGGKGGKAFGGATAATLRNGEVVGAGAAELGKENFGHKLMEKMGWSKGMALGREGEGRLVPVEQVVRLGTAGLG